MKLELNIRSAFSNLLASKLRSALAILGILIGTGSVVALVSSGQLATNAALAQFKALGTDLLSINIYNQRTQGDHAKVQTRDFTLEDAFDLRKADTDIELVAPYTSAYQNISYNGQHLNGSIIGATDALKDVIKLHITQGRFVSLLDRYSPFCVIGHKLYQSITNMGISDPIGTQIRLGKHYFTIIGTIDDWPQNMFFNQDINQSMIIPIGASMMLSKYTKINNVVFRLKPNSNIDQLKKHIESYMHQVAPNKKVYIVSPKEIIKRMENQQQTFTLLLGVIGGISLLVGGIGVMNIMLVSVVERRREIGIRRAIGAKQRDIEVLFLAESVALSLTGGIMGVLFGILASYIIATFSGWEFTIFIKPALLGFFVSAAIGIFFGYYPAHRASRP